MSLVKIEKQAKLHSNACRALTALLSELQEEIDAAKERRIKRVRRLLAKVVETRGVLADLVRAAPDSFKSPKSRTFHGVKCGYKKAPGKVLWKDEQAVVAAIQRLLPAQQKELIKTTETPIKAALSRLSAGVLKKLGVTVEDTSDKPFVQTVDSELEKLAAALTEDAPAAPEEAA